MSSPAAQDIGIIVLAAGSSSRFGKDKRQARLSSGETLLDATLASIPDSFVHKLLVLKTEDTDLAARVPDNWQVCFTDQAGLGMAHSLASGIAAADAWEGALVALADMPDIEPQTYRQLQQALTRHDIVVPCVGDRQGNPVGFRQKFFAEIKRLTGDQGAKSLLRQYSDLCCTLETGDEGIFRDIDIPEKLT